MILVSIRRPRLSFLSFLLLVAFSSSRTVLATFTHHINDLRMIASNTCQYAHNSLQCLQPCWHACHRKVLKNHQGRPSSSLLLFQNHDQRLAKRRGRRTISSCSITSEHHHDIRSTIQPKSRSSKLRLSQPRGAKPLELSCHGGNTHFSSLPSSTSLSMVSRNYLSDIVKEDEECIVPPSYGIRGFSTRTRDPNSDFSVRGTIISGNEGYGGVFHNSNDQEGNLRAFVEKLDDSKNHIVWVETLGKDELCQDYDELQKDRHRREHHLEQERLEDLSQKPFSVLSWNILAQSLYESHYVTSSEINDHNLRRSGIHPHPWPKRLEIILKTLSHSQSDIICLQECELHLFKSDLVPAMWELGYEGIAQEDDRPTFDFGDDCEEGTHGIGSGSSDDATVSNIWRFKPTDMRELAKHRDPRNHIVATFWKRDKFQVVGKAYIRTRSMTTVLRLKGSMEEEDEYHSANESKPFLPTVAIINCHLEGDPRKFSARTHQLQGALTDLSKRLQSENQLWRANLRNKKKGKKDENQSTLVRPNEKQHISAIGTLNALIIAGDFNCELQSSACSTYLRIGRLGRQAGLGGIHGEDSLAIPPSLLETSEANDVLHPIMEWGRALPDDLVADVAPHPFRRNGMTSAYPAWLGKNDAREHFTYCSEMTRRPVPGLDQIWFSSVTLERVALKRMFVDHLDEWSSDYEQNGNNEDAANYVEKKREKERKSVLRTGLPDPKCKYPSDHLPIGCIFDWKLDANDDVCIIDDGSGKEYPDDPSTCMEVEVKGLKIVDSKGKVIEQVNLNSPSHANSQSEPGLEEMNQRNFETPREELEYFLQNCPYDSERQKSDVFYVLSAIEPPLSTMQNSRPTPEQLKQLNDRRDKRAEVLATASLGVRPWLKNIWKASKKVGTWEREDKTKETRKI
ncbi:hypothetical protein ACHAXS_004912 [Conticribra weissflogii]